MRELVRGLSGLTLRTAIVGGACAVLIGVPVALAGGAARCDPLLGRYGGVNKSGNPWILERISAVGISCDAARAQVKAWNRWLNRPTSSPTDYGYYRHYELVYGRYGRRYPVGGFLCRTKALPPGAVPIIPSVTRCVRDSASVVFSYRAYKNRPRSH